MDKIPGKLHSLRHRERIYGVHNPLTKAWIPPNMKIPPVQKTICNRRDFLCSKRVMRELLELLRLHPEPLRHSLWRRFDIGIQLLDQRRILLCRNIAKKNRLKIRRSA